MQPDKLKALELLNNLLPKECRISLEPFIDTKEWYDKKMLEMEHGLALYILE